MRIIWLVLEDLGTFLLSHFRVSSAHIETASRAALKAPTPPILLPAEEKIVLGDNVEQSEEMLEEVEVEPVQTFRTIRDILPNFEAPVEANEPAIIRRNMVVGRAHEPLYVRPVREYDGVLAKLPYGATVSTGAVVQQWVDVVYKEMSGFVHRDALYESVSQTRPYFVVKEFAGPTSTNTLRLRSIIDDEFAAAVLELPLQAEEYVYYRLLTVGVVPPVITTRPRIAGTWQRIYRGLKGVRIGVRPKTNAVMEYIDANDVGHLAYVEAVFPDESITVSEIGSPEPGYYNERTLDKASWQELQAIFIQFS